jgi:ribosomal-protein-alanine N-acetyltransferase
MRAIETPRLRLRPFTPADTEDHRRLYADPEVTRFLGRGPTAPGEVPARSARVLAEFVAHWSERGFGPWAVIDRASGQLIGQCGLRHWPVIDDIELLYAVARPYWGRGLVTEAARAALAHGFREVGLRRVVAVTWPDHAASRAVIARLGMRLESEVVLLDRPAVLYALTAADFGDG